MKKIFLFFLVLFFLGSCLPLEDNSFKRPPRKNCSLNSDCVEGLCTSNNFCADCEEDADCNDANLICSNYNCILKNTAGSCLTNNDCNSTPSTPKCNVALKTCVECLHGVSGQDTCPTGKYCSSNNTCLDNSTPPPATYYKLGNTCSGSSTSNCKYQETDPDTSNYIFPCKCAQSWTGGTSRWVVAANNSCSRHLSNNDTKPNRYWCENNKYCTYLGADYKCIDAQCGIYANNECNFDTSKPKCKTTVSPRVCVQCLSTGDCSSFQQTPECNTSQNLCVPSAGQTCNVLLSSCATGSNPSLCTYPSVSNCIYDCKCISNKWRIDDGYICDKDYTQSNVCKDNSACDSTYGNCCPPGGVSCAQ